MAEIFTFQSFEDEVEQQEDSNSPSNSAFFVPSFDDFDRSLHSTDSDSDYSDLYDDDVDQISYVTDLFHIPNDDHPHVDHTNSNSRVLPDYEELGFGSDFDGLRVVGSGSESDSEELEVNSGVIDRNGDSGLWSSSRVDDLDENFEWEEVDERVQVRDNVSYVIDRMEEISVSSDTSSEEGNPGLIGSGLREQIRTLQMELLAAVHNLEREFGNVVRIRDDGIFRAEYDAMLGLFHESEGTLKGSPPAAKSVVENLPLVVFKDENLKESNAACAVCKDEILVSEKATRLPCSHYYHCDCIVPWLSIRNTCPVCCHELPTDDADYERRKNGRSAAAAFINDFQVR